MFRVQRAEFSKTTAGSRQLDEMDVMDVVNPSIQSTGPTESTPFWILNSVFYKKSPALAARGL